MSDLNFSLPLTIPLTCDINEGPYGPPPSDTLKAKMTFNDWDDITVNQIYKPLKNGTRYLWVLHDEPGFVCLSISEEKSFIKSDKSSRILKHPDLVVSESNILISSKCNSFVIYLRPAARYAGELYFDKGKYIVDNNSSYVFSRQDKRRITASSTRNFKRGTAYPWYRFVDIFLKKILGNDVAYYDIADETGSKFFLAKKFAYPDETATELLYGLKENLSINEEEKQNEIQNLRNAISCLDITKDLYKQLYFKSRASKKCSLDFKKQLYKLFQHYKYEKSLFLQKYFRAYGKYLGIKHVTLDKNLITNIKKLSYSDYFAIINTVEKYHNCQISEYPLFFQLLQEKSVNPITPKPSSKKILQPTELINCWFCEKSEMKSVKALKTHISRKHKNMREHILNINTAMSKIDEFSAKIAHRDQWSLDIGPPVIQSFEIVPTLERKEAEWTSSMSEGDTPFDFCKKGLSYPIVQYLVNLINKNLAAKKSKSHKKPITEREFWLFMGKYLCYCLTHVPVRRQQHGQNTLYRSEYIS